MAGRALRQIPREPTSVIPAVFVPAFFYIVNLGALENVANRAAGFDYKAFLIPMAIAFAVTGMSRAPTLVTDIQRGYFDRLCLTPVRRSALLLGLMVADVVVIVASVRARCWPSASRSGVRFATGPAGRAGLRRDLGPLGSRLHRLPLRGRPQDGEPGRGRAPTFVVFFPLFFLSDAVVPKQVARPGGSRPSPPTTR